MRKILGFICFLFSSHMVMAEYRVFVLQITNSQTREIKQIHSTLDPIQYANVFPLGVNEKISYVESWKCKGRTDFFKTHCPNPRQLLDQEPAVVSIQSPENPN